MANVIRILVEADDKASDKLGKVGKVGVAAFGAAGVAAGAFAVSSAKAFIGFERQMNEVFTLLPGISQEAMNKMEGQVKSFSKEFGTLPDEVVPALYQALSAGVPQDNVFEFLETAQKAAIGGVTDLTTAVGAISGPVNAYGAEVLSAADAADIMFTGVKTGVTTFGELASTLANVTPIAASLGIGFDEVVGSVAALTTVGFSTAQAVTGLRGAVVELAKDGTKVSAAFEDLAGVSFPTFIEQGGTVEQAFTMLQSAAEASGITLLDLFGSMEGGQAAMALGAENGAKLAGIMDEMAVRAGNATGAFETMDEGVGRNLEKLRANFEVLKLEVGEALMPALVAATDWLLENIPKWGETWEQDVQPAVEEFMKVMRDDVGPVVVAVGELVVEFARVVQENWDHISEVIDTWWNVTVGPIFAALEDTINGIAALLRGDWSGAWTSFANAAISAAETLANGMADAFNFVIRAYNNTIGRLPGVSKIGEIGDIEFGRVGGPAFGQPGSQEIRPEAIQGPALPGGDTIFPNLVEGPVRAAEEAGAAAGDAFVGGFTGAIGGGGGGGGGGSSPIADAVEDVAEEIAALTTDTFGAAFDEIAADRALQESIGRTGFSLMEAMRVALEEGGERNINAVAKMANDLVDALGKKLPEGQAAFLTTEFMEAIRETIEKGTPEALGAFEYLLSRINSVIEGGAIDIRSGVVLIADEVNELADAIGATAEFVINHVQELVDMGMLSMLDDLAVLPEAARTAIDDLVEQIMRGEAELEDLLNLLNKVTGADGSRVMDTRTFREKAVDIWGFDPFANISDTGSSGLKQGNFNLGAQDIISAIISGNTGGITVQVNGVGIDQLTHDVSVNGHLVYA